VLKPRLSRFRTPQGFQTGEVSYVTSAAALPAAWQAQHQRIPLPLVQERIPGHGMGVFVLAERGDTRVRFAHRRLREKPPTGGVSVLRESIRVPEELVEPATRLVAALAWHGVCMIEFRVDARDGTPYLMELNPRFWGSLQLAIEAGVDFPRLLYFQTQGESLAAPAAYRLGVRCRWVLGDLDHLLIRLRRRPSRADLPPHAPGLARAVLDFLNPFAGRPEVMWTSDPAPGWYELRNYLRKILGAVSSRGDPAAPTR
jgi:predicted ATP-grasp superfamily ATP-dependent carboligase